MHVIIISAPAPNAYINLWTSIIKYSTLNAKCNGQQISLLSLVALQSLSIDDRRKFRVQIMLYCSTSKQ